MTDTDVLPGSLHSSEQALHHLRNAYLLLLANHGHLDSLAAQQTRDLLGLGVNNDALLSREDDQGEMNACNARYLEAQTLLEKAQQALGRPPTGELDHLAIPVALLDRLGGRFDAIALTDIIENRKRNQQMVEQVRALYDEVRVSMPSRSPPLPSLALSQEGASVGERAADVVGLVTGSHPRFWPASHWLLLGVVLLGALALAFFLGGVWPQR
jgi:hypothetical protein